MAKNGKKIIALVVGLSYLLPSFTNVYAAGRGDNFTYGSKLVNGRLPEEYDTTITSEYGGIINTASDDYFVSGRSKFKNQNKQKLHDLIGESFKYIGLKHYFDGIGLDDIHFEDMKENFKYLIDNEEEVKEDTERYKYKLKLAEFRVVTEGGKYLVKRYDYFNGVDETLKEFEIEEGKLYQPKNHPENLANNYAKEQINEVASEICNKVGRNAPNRLKQIIDADKKNPEPFVEYQEKIMSLCVGDRLIFQQKILWAKEEDERHPSDKSKKTLKEVKKREAVEFEAWQNQANYTSRSREHLRNGVRMASTVLYSNTSTNADYINQYIILQDRIKGLVANQRLIPRDPETLANYQAWPLYHTKCLLLPEGDNGARFYHKLENHIRFDPYRLPIRDEHFRENYTPEVFKGMEFYPAWWENAEEGPNVHRVNYNILRDHPDGPAPEGYHWVYVEVTIPQPWRIHFGITDEEVKPEDKLDRLKMEEKALKIELNTVRLPYLSDELLEEMYKEVTYDREPSKEDKMIALDKEYQKELSSRPYKKEWKPNPKHDQVIGEVGSRGLTVREFDPKAKTEKLKFLIKKTEGYAKAVEKARDKYLRTSYEAESAISQFYSSTDNYTKKSKDNLRRQSRNLNIKLGNPKLTPGEIDGLRSELKAAIAGLEVSPSLTPLQPSIPIDYSTKDALVSAIDDLLKNPDLSRTEKNRLELMREEVAIFAGDDVRVDRYIGKWTNDFIDVNNTISDRITTDRNNYNKIISDYVKRYNELDRNIYTEESLEFLDKIFDELEGYNKNGRLFDLSIRIRNIEIAFSALRYVDATSALIEARDKAVSYLENNDNISDDYKDKLNKMIEKANKLIDEEVKNSDLNSLANDILRTIDLSDREISNRGKSIGGVDLGEDLKNAENNNEIVDLDNNSPNVSDSEKENATEESDSLDINLDFNKLYEKTKELENSSVPIEDKNELIKKVNDAIENKKQEKIAPLIKEIDEAVNKSIKEKSENKEIDAKLSNISEKMDNVIKNKAFYNQDSYNKFVEESNKIREKLIDADLSTINLLSKKVDNLVNNMEIDFSLTKSFLNKRVDILESKAKTLKDSEFKNKVILDISNVKGSIDSLSKSSDINRQAVDEISNKIDSIDSNVDRFIRGEDLIEDSKNNSSNYIKRDQDYFEKLKMLEEIYKQRFDNLSNMEKSYYESIISSFKYDDLENNNKENIDKFIKQISEKSYKESDVNNNLDKEGSKKEEKRKIGGSAYYQSRLNVFLKDYSEKSDKLSLDDKKAFDLRIEELKTNKDGLYSYIDLQVLENQFYSIVGR